MNIARHGMTAQLYLLTFDFKDPVFTVYDNELLNLGAGVSSEDMVTHALMILTDLSDIYEVLDYLDTKVFPEHVPNDALRYTLSLCVEYLTYLVRVMHLHRTSLYGAVSGILEVIFEPRTDTLNVIIN